LSSDPNASAQLNNASFALISDGTSLVQFSLDIADTKGRLAAAIAAGDATSTANQQLWLSQFQTLFNNELTSLKYDMQTYSSLLAVEYPAFYNYTVTPDQVESVLSQEASGTFDSALQLALTDWQINGNLLNEVEAGFGSLSPSDIQAAGSMTTGGALTLLTDQLSELTVPEPTSMTLLAVGALALGLMMRVGRSSK
jgi:hypothetical protein